MATVTLGNIKFNWKGAWNSGTAYVIDDVVSLSGSSYVSIQAGTNQNPASASAYWQQMSAAGTNGTDLTSTLTTQGDIVYRDGSGLQRLGKPASNKFLQMTSGGVASWEDAGGGKILQVTHRQTTSVLSSSTSSFVATDNYVQITPSATSSKVFVFMNGQGGMASGDPWSYVEIYRQIGTGSFTALTKERRVAPGSGASLVQDITHQFIDQPNTTSEVTYKVYWYGGGGNAFYNGRSSSESSIAFGTAMEIGA